ncbi:MAG: type IV toxin-antitoxin system AbiEi family antitoxin [Candidatus Bathyarchaeum tardum]|nr:MAG: type IV toxin-antitoxin system AbiEi family antitoxin [Candidatus Bathyarchaeum tardum]
MDAGQFGANNYTVHSFVIASYLVTPYYVSHWSALNYHGLSEQTPPHVYIATTKPRNRKKILNVDFVFVTVSKRKMFGIQTVKIDNHPVNISSVEKTIVDCLDHPEHCGGIAEIAKSIYFEHDNLDFNFIIKMARMMKNKTILKRLGYVLETFNFDQHLDLFNPNDISKGYSKLDPKMPKKGKINEKWKLYINSKIDSRMWKG